MRLRYCIIRFARGQVHVADAERKTSMPELQGSWLISSSTRPQAERIESTLHGLRRKPNAVRGELN